MPDRRSPARFPWREFLLVVGASSCAAAAAGFFTGNIAVAGIVSCATIILAQLGIERRK